MIFPITRDNAVTPTKLLDEYRNTTEIGLRYTRTIIVTSVSLCGVSVIPAKVTLGSSYLKVIHTSQW